MKSIEILLSGIGFIVFGIACLLILELLEYSELFWTLGNYMPFVGIIIIIIGIARSLLLRK